MAKLISPYEYGRTAILSGRLQAAGVAPALRAQLLEGGEAILKSTASKKSGRVARRHAAHGRTAEPRHAPRRARPAPAASQRFDATCPQRAPAAGDEGHPTGCCICG